MTAGTTATASLEPVVDGAEVVVCCGAGGVGKTTAAAALAIEAARRGRRVVVVTIDPARRLADALGIPGGLTGEPQRVVLDRRDRRDTEGRATDGELWAMMLDTPAMFERVVRAHAPEPDQADRIVENRFYQNIAGALSGTQEYMASEALHELHGDVRFDLVVVDTPPSRNALDFLEAPGVLTRFLDHPVFKLMMAPTRTGLKVVSAVTQPLLRAIGRVVGTDVLSDAVAFFHAFAGMEAGFRERADAVTALLHADATRFVVVTTPTRDSVAEAAWFADQLAGRGLDVAATIVNRMQPVFGDGTAADARTRADAALADGDETAAALWANLAELGKIAAAQRGALEPLRARAGDRLVGVPLLAGDVHDIATLTELGGHLFPATMR